MNSQKEKYLEIFSRIDFEKIKDHPNILIAARFWDNDRYEAAKTCYRFMRAIDDLIDNHKAQQKGISPQERGKFISDVNEWLLRVMVPGDGDPEKEMLTETVKRFVIPLWPLEAFARAMVYDINNDGFPTFEAFLDYAQGASVAPASIFVHLSGISGSNGNYKSPAFDVREAATPCAVFSYLVHIIRDFQKDQFNNLNYFADDLVMKFGLTRKKLFEIAHGSPVPGGFRDLVRHYLEIADSYRTRTREIMDRIEPFLEERYLLGMEIIYDLYTMVFERIDAERGSFTTGELNPTAEETRSRVYNTIMNFR
jgi:phytoene/squalene synthetase